MAGLFDDLKDKAGGLFDDLKADSAAAPKPLPPDFQGYGASGFRDPQRKATALEGTLDVLNTAEYVGAGLGNRAPGENMIDAMRRGIRERRTYGENIAKDPSVLPGAAAGAGLMAAVALDPLTYLSFGTVPLAGRLARSAKIAEELAAIRGGTAPARAAGVAELGVGLGEQAARGQRALVSVLGKPVVKGEGVYRTIDTAWERMQRLYGVTEPKALGGVEGQAKNQMVRELRAVVQLAKQDAQRKLQPHASVIDAAAAKYDIDRTALDRILTLAVERAKDPTLGTVSPASIKRSVREATAALSPEAQRAIGPATFRMVRDVNALNELWLGRMMDAGIDIGPLQSQRINYMPRIKTPEGAAAIRRAQELGTGSGPGGIGMGNFDVITERTPSMHERTFKEWDTPSVNDLAAAEGLPATGNRPVVGGPRWNQQPAQMFVENPMAATVMHAGQAAKSAKSAELIKGYVDRYGKRLPDLSELELAGHPAGIREQIREKMAKEYERAGFAKITTKVKGYEDAYIPADMVAPFKRHMNAQANPQGAAKLLKQYNRMWARWTVAFPVTQARNQLGDFYNGYIIGGTTLGDLGDAMSLVDLPGHKATREAIVINGARYTRQEINDLAQRMGIMQSTRTEQFAPASSVLRERPRSAGEAVGRAVNENFYQRRFWKAAETRDYTNRLAMFIHGLKEGLSPEASTLRVMEHFFDYADLGPAASGIRDYAMPFLAWTRYNVPFQLRNIATKPGIAGGTQKVREFAAQASGEDSGDLGLPGGVELPRFMAQGLPMRMGSNKAGDHTFLRGEGTHPLADLAVVDPRQAFQRAMGLVSPSIKTPLEIGTGINTFASDWASGDIRKFERFPGETTNLVGVPMSKRWVAPVISALPGGRAISELNRLNPFDVFGTQAKPGVTGYTRTNPDVDPAARWMSMVIGRPYSFNVEQEAARQSFRDMSELRRWQMELGFARSRGDASNVAILEQLIEKKLAELNSGQAPQEAKP